MESNAWLILIAVITYLLGSIPTAYFVTKAIIGQDVRRAGTRNIGAMNAYRLIKAERSTRLGIAGFALSLVGDMGKGALAIFIAKWLSVLTYDPKLALIISSLFVILGHNHSPFLKFGGGRGLASLGGILLALNPLSFLIGLGTFLLSIFLAHYLLGGRVQWGKFSAVFSVAGSQVVGRVAGMAIALVPIYFFSPEIFPPIVAGMILVLIRHVGRVKTYVKELKTAQK